MAMANSAPTFTKQETVAFDKVFEGFQDGLVVSKLFGKFDVDAAIAERSGNTVWRPMPYIAQSFTGIDQSSNFAATTRSCPCRRRCRTATRCR
jgi:hypothetical protein